LLPAALFLCASVARAGKLEVSSGNLRSKRGVEDVKLSWDKTFKLRGHATKLSGTYDMKAKKDFLSSVALSGTVSSPPAPYFGVFKVGYDLSHSFKSNMQALKLSASAKGATLKATVDSHGLKFTEFLARSKYDSLSFQPSYKPPNGVVELTLGSRDLAATLYYNTKRKSVDYKLAASRQLGAGRGVEAEVAADGVDVSYFDSTFEEGAKWTATLSAPFSRLSDAGVQLRRTMSF